MRGQTKRALKGLDVRKENRSVLLLDAGNALFGADTMPSEGAVMLSAYAELDYDAVNLSYRDFRLGKEATVELIEAEQIPFVSANLVDEDTGDLLAKPYVIIERPSRKIDILGVTQKPAGLAYLQHLQDQLAGVRIDPPEEAVTRWLPQAREQAGRVILLYYGSYAGLEPIRERFADQFDAILVGGTCPDYLSMESVPPIILETAVGRRPGCVPGGGWQGTTRRNSWLFQHCNAAGRRLVRAPGGVATSPIG